MKRLMCAVACALFVAVPASAQQASATAWAAAASATSDFESAFDGDFDSVSSQQLSDDLKIAQTRYYEASATKVQEGLTTSGWMKENAAVFVGLAAAALTLLSLLQTVRTTSQNFRLSLDNSEEERRARVDEQFYEALKRFGDQTSPSIRSAAAALIAQIASTRDTPDSGYVDVAVAQLPIALHLEENPVVLKSVVDAIKVLCRSSTDTYLAAQVMLEELYHVNRKILTDLLMTGPRFLIASGCALEKGRWQNKDLVQIATRLNLPLNIVSATLAVTAGSQLFEIERQVFGELAADKRLEASTGLAAELEVLGRRLWANKQALCLCLMAVASYARIIVGPRQLLLPSAPKTLRGGGKVEKARQCLAHVILTDVSLKCVNLSGANLDGAQLERSDFLGANLSNASLKNSNLRRGNFQDTAFLDADMDGADLTDALLGGSKIDEAKLVNCEWWRANFDGFFNSKSSGPTPIGFDKDLVDRLFTKFASTVPAHSGRFFGCRDCLSGDYIKTKLAELP